MKQWIIFILLMMSFNAHAQIITVFAGGGTMLGDGGPATAASVEDPCSGIFDAYGNYYFSEPIENRVRKINTAGIITTVAGTGVSGYNGDSILATSAELYVPDGVAVDTIGNLYIADGGNNRIRKVDMATGLIYTVAGNGTGGYGGDGGLATDAMLYDPQCMRFDPSGNMYIGDYFNARVRKVNTSGIMSTFIGTGVGGYSGDGFVTDTSKIGGVEDISIDTAGNIYLADNYNTRVFKVNTSGFITTIAGTDTGYLYDGDDIPATDANVDPWFIGLNDSGQLFIAERYNNRVRKIDASGIIHTVAGNGMIGSSGEGGPAVDAELYDPNGIAFDHCNNLYIAEASNPRISKVIFNTTGTPAITIAANADTVCSGTAVTYIASVTGSSTFAYQWIVNGTVVSTTGSTFSYSPANGDSVKCILAGTGQCSGAHDTVSSNTVRMVVNAAGTPTVAVTGAATATAGSTVTLTATVSGTGGSYTIKWYDDGVLFATTTTPVVTYTTSAGTDSITAIIIPTGGCYDSATSAVHVITVKDEGIYGVSKQAVRVYPNPAHNSLSLTFSYGEENVIVSNLMGQQLIEQQVSGNKMNIDISSLSPGVYVLTVTGSDGERTTTKIIKE